MRRLASVAVAVTAILMLASSAGARTARVLRVGVYKGVSGQFGSIQAAIDAARPGDWVLVGPGDYHSQADHRANRGPQPADSPAGIVISKSYLHLVGMNRNGVIIDGTKPGSKKCSSAPAAQDFGPQDAKGARLGRNGILIWKANWVTVDNLTVCNFLAGSSGNVGNEIWWDGGADSAKIGGYGFTGKYLSTTSTYFNPAKPSTAAQYGIFSSDWSGGLWNQSYASNFNDSGYYIGACAQVCNQTLDHGHGEYNALGYSGSNSGGKLVIENSEFNANQDGFDTNSQNGDEPSPQNGACPNNGVSPITHTHSCWVFMHNYVHDNNNPNVPALGSAAQGPVGTGMSLSGARNDTIMNNRFVRNNAWGVILVPYPDSGPPCIGGTLNAPLLGQGGCLFDGWGNALINNEFSHNGSFGHPTNGDFAQLSLEDGHPTNCYRGNTESGGGSIVPQSAAALQQTRPVCNGSTGPASSSDARFLGEVLCDSQVSLGSGPPACPTGPYPKRTQVIMHPLPTGLSTMPEPCAGVPANPWCPKRKHSAPSSNYS